jgi:hypothetical protein
MMGCCVELMVEIVLHVVAIVVFGAWGAGVTGLGTVPCLNTVVLNCGLLYRFKKLETA